jgi:cytochrome c oxidase subunit IV
LSTTVPTTPPQAEEHHGVTPAEPGAHAHPSEGVYLIVALVPAALTAIEVGLYYLKGGLTYIPLLVLMLMKFLIVVGFFMHLRFDSPLFRRLFAMGLGMASLIYCATFFIFGVFHV